MFKYDDVYKSSLDYFDGDELAAGVFAGKYALSDRDGSTSADIISSLI